MTASAQYSLLEWAYELAVVSAVCISWAELHLFHFVWSMSPDFVRSHCSKEGIRQCYFDEASLRALPLQPPFCLSNGNHTAHFFSSRTLACGFFITYCISCTAARGHPPLAIIAIVNARHISDCSSSTWPPCLAIVADMLKTYKKVVAACNNEIQLVCPPYTLLWPPLRRLQPVMSTPGNAYHKVCARLSQSW